MMEKSKSAELEADNLKAKLNMDTVILDKGIKIQDAFKLIDRDDFRAVVLDKVYSDPEYRDALIKNPKKALLGEFGVFIPTQVTLEVVVEQPNQFIVVIPWVGAPGKE